MAIFFIKTTYFRSETIEIAKYAHNKKIANYDKCVIERTASSVVKLKRKKIRGRSAFSHARTTVYICGVNFAEADASAFLWNHPKESEPLIEKINRSKIKMMKKIKKTVAALLAATLTVVTISFAGVSCKSKTSGGSTIKIDKNRTQLYVGVLDAGLGTKYFDEMAKDFEEAYKLKSFEDGKTGVQVIPTKKKDPFTPKSLIASMEGQEIAMYFLDKGDYDTFAGKGLLADVTETMQEKVYDEDGQLASISQKPAVSSMEDNMLDGYKECFLRNGKYYATPFWISIPGIIYDADLFSQKGWYFKADGTLGAKQSDIDAQNCGKGPDGILGTADDGLPATWNDFNTLIKAIRNANMVPFTWDMTYSYELRGVFKQIWANYEGYDNFMLNYTFNGHDSGLNKDITEGNFADLIDQEGRKAAVKAFYDIAGNGKNFSGDVGQNNTEAQFKFIDSKYNGKRIAMFMECSYWESESRSDFDDAGQIDPNDGYGKRDFRIMPIPNFVGVDGIKDQTNTEKIFAGEGSDTYICLSAKNKCKNPGVQQEIAKLFLQFVHQRDQLIKFTANTGCLRAFNYTADEEDMKTFTKYTQSIMRYIGEGAKVVSNLPIAQKRKDHSDKFSDGNDLYAFSASRNGSVPAGNVYLYMENNGEWAASGVYKGPNWEACYKDYVSTFKATFNF